MNDCCCDDPKAPTGATPTRTGSGSSMPPKEGGASITLLAGAHGTESNGDPLARVVETTSTGALKVHMSGAFLVKQAAIADLNLGSDAYTPTINAILAALRAIGAIAS